MLNRSNLSIPTRWRRIRARLLLSLAAAAALPSLARAQDVSAPVFLQYFESKYNTIESRMPDVFAAGYGAIYTPPPGRADQGNLSVGYDQYNRFDLGSPGNETLYGTETGLKTLTSATHRAGLDSYVDLVWNHDGFSDLSTPGFTAAGGYPGLAITLPNAIDGDFHSSFASGDLDGRISGLVDIDQSTNFQMIRNPVGPDSRNIPAGTTPAFGRLANVPDPNNARFYPDHALQPIMVFDPKTGEANIPIYPFNNANPLAGDATPENALGYLMRNAQWLVQVIGVDGFRLDAEKHYPTYVLNYLDRAVYRSNPRLQLDGTQKNVFSFGEVFDGNQSLLQSYVEKSINPANPGVIGANRDVLDFPLFFALHDNLTNNGLNNSWYNVRSASFDLNDDGLHNGSQGVTFVSSHDNTGPDLGNVAYAYTLMMPGNTIVYFNAKEFGNNRDFPKDGRGDALGGQYGSAITTLVDIRNRYGRGNYIERWIEKEIFAYERQGSAIVLLSNRTDAGYDSRTLQTSFTPGTRLIELTGNAANPTDDPFNDIPEMVQVKGDGTVDVRFLRNTAPGTSNQTGAGYLIYGLPTPKGAVTLSNPANNITILPGSTSGNNATTRVNDLSVIKSDSFQVTLNTQKYFVLNNAAWRNHDADGDNALVKIDDGIDVNGNGHVDFTTPGAVEYGFENFVTTKTPGYTSANNNGLYVQNIDATQLSEGTHFITVRSFRHRSDGGPAVFTDFRESIYVDRLPPISNVESFNPIVPNNLQNRQVLVRSVDQTANSVHVFLNLPAALTDDQVAAMVGANSQATQTDRDLFAYPINNAPSGNEVLTVVTYEMTGTRNVQRFPGIATSTTNGVGIGNLNFDNTINVADMQIFDTVLYSNNTQFNPAADLNADGLITPADLILMGPFLGAIRADAATIYKYNDLLINPPTAVTHNYPYTFDNSAGAALAKFGPGALILSGTQIHGPGASLTLNAGHTDMNSDAGSPASSTLAVTVNSTASITFGVTQHLKSLTVNGGLASVAPGHGKALVVDALSLTNSGVLDLADNDLVVRYPSGAFDPNHTSALEKQIQQWVANWSSLGSTNARIMSSVGNNTTFAVFDNAGQHWNSIDGIPLGTTPGMSEIIVKYVYAGDADLNGRVDPSDYQIISSNLGRGTDGHDATWDSGNLDFNGVVNPTDYFQVTSNLGAGNGAAGGPLLANIAAVPEPAGLLALATLAVAIAHRPRSFRRFSK